MSRLRLSALLATLQATATSYECGGCGCCDFTDGILTCEDCARLRQVDVRWVRRAIHQSSREDRIATVLGRIAAVRGDRFYARASGNEPRDRLPSLGSVCISMYWPVLRYYPEQCV